MLLLGSGGFLATSMYVFAKFCFGCGEETRIRLAIQGPFGEPKFFHVFAV